MRLLDAGVPQLAGEGLFAIAAYGFTEVAALLPTLFGRLRRLPTRVPVAIGASSILITIGMFLVPPGLSHSDGGQSPSPLLVLGIDLLAIGVLLALALVLAAVLIVDRRAARPWRRRVIDICLCLILAMVVFQLAALPPVDMFFHHHAFYLGPVNDMAHGRTMLTDVWAQYGVGVYYGLLAAFTILPLHHGGLVILLSTLMVAQYLILYLTLRIAVRSQVLVTTAVIAAVMANIFASMGSYVTYPSIGPLRFGFPYLVVLAAVTSARWPQWTQAMRVAQFAIVAISAIWSFETFVYTAATWSALIMLLAFGRQPGAMKLFARESLIAMAVCVIAVSGLTISTRVVSGVWPDWGGYFAYIRLYSVDEFGNLPLNFWSPGLIMAAVIFLSAVGVISIVRDERIVVSGPVLSGLAGFTGFAAATFTYYLGRSHPNNLLNLIVPVCALGCLWTSIFLVPREAGHRRTWRLAPVVAFSFAAISLIAIGIPSVALKWPNTLFSQAVPFADGHAPGHGGMQVAASLRHLWRGRTFDDSIAESGAKLLQRHDPGHGPVLIVISQATEVLLKLHRVNLLPISHPEQDNLILSREWPRIAKAIDGIRDGTILLTSSLHPQSEPLILLRARERIQIRFESELLENTQDGLQIIRLHLRT
ncbi:MAG: hypothetical protein EKK34_28680 [Mycobacterium sp.]|nr:MAG: hypothetical protein EKK34_28680 [Mycobacterium sp.]